MSIPPDMARDIEQIVGSEGSAMDKIRRICIELKGTKADGKRRRTNEDFSSFLSERGHSLDEKSIGFFTAAGSSFRIISSDWLKSIWSAYERDRVSSLTEGLKSSVLRIRRDAEEELAFTKLFKPPEPDAMEYTKHPYRFVKTDLDLNPFVTLSDNEEDIRDVHDTLSGRKRRALYEKWLGWSPFSFLYLVKQHPTNGTVEPTAVSIVLPLSERGYDRIWRNRETDAVGLERDDIHAGSGDPRALLLDTWIVRPKGRTKSFKQKVIRTTHGGYAGAMITVHAGLLWTGRTDISILVEPDSPKMTNMCRKLGFEPSADDKCFRFHFSPGETHQVGAQPFLFGHVEKMRSRPEYP